jgi:hypothetical protein
VETSTGSGIYKVVPVDISADQDINIKVKITLTDGTEQIFGADLYKL